jgi:hypothetical protein
MNSYWNDTGKYQTDYGRLWGLVPPSGSSNVVAGEMTRAITKLIYDFYNNGCCNNTSGALNYLEQMGVIGSDLKNIVHDNTRGKFYGGSYNGDTVQTTFEKIADTTIEYILANPELETTENDDDMWNYGDPDLEFCTSCGDPLQDGDYGWNGMCEHCVCEDCGECTYECSCEEDNE